MSIAAQIFNPLGNLRSPWTYLKTAAFLGILYEVTASKFLSSSDDIINSGHRVSNYLLSGDRRELDNKFYNQRATDDPNFAGLGGWRDPLRWLTRFTVIGVGATMFLKESSQYIIGEGSIPFRRGLIWTFGYLTLYGIARLWSDCAGNAMIRERKPGTTPWNPENFHPEEDFSWNVYSSHWALEFFYSPVFARGTRIARNATNILYHRLGSSGSRRFFARSISPETAQNEIMAFQAGEKEKIKLALAGSRRELWRPRLGWQMFLGAGALYLVYRGFEALNSLRGEEKSPNPYSDGFWLGLGTLAATALIGTITRIPKIANPINALSLCLEYFFKAPRLGYTALFSLLVGLSSSAAFLGIRLAQGYRDPTLLAIESLRSFVIFLPNRILWSAWAAFTDKPLSLLGFYMPSMILTYHPLAIWNQTKETGTQKYRELAQAYRYSIDPQERRDYGWRLTCMEEALHRRIAQTTGPSIFSSQLERIQEIREEFCLPQWTTG
jgi:hypothetical protein